MERIFKIIIDLLSIGVGLFSILYAKKLGIILVKSSLALREAFNIKRELNKEMIV